MYVCLFPEHPGIGIPVILLWIHSQEMKNQQLNSLPVFMKYSDGNKYSIAYAIEQSSAHTLMKQNFLLYQKQFI